MSRLSHDTRLARKHAVRPEEYYDFQVGEAVIADGFPGRVVAVLDGVFARNESYQVVLDNGMGGGEYDTRQLYRAPARVAAAQEDVATPELDPFEGAERTTAALWYPELGSILEDRPPIENLKVYAARTAAFEPQPEEGGDPAEDVAEAEQPDTCSFCGSPEFDEFEDTGRGTRARCAQCDGTMVKPYDGIQWSTEFPNSPANRPSRAPDSRAIINDPSAVHSSLRTASYRMEHTHRTVPPNRYSPDGHEEHRVAIFSDAPEDAHEFGDFRPGEVSYIEHQPQPDGGTVVQMRETRDNHQRRGLQTQLQDELHRQHEYVQSEDDGPSADAVAFRDHYLDHHPDAQWVTPDTSDWGTKHSSLNAVATAQARYPIFTGLPVPELPQPHFEFTASWREVQAKASRLRKEGRVRVLGASHEGAVGEVDGDTSIYETEFHFLPGGGRKVAYWHCGCKWAAWANTERTPLYQRFQNRPCSHNLALRYSVQAKGMYGRDVTPDTDFLEGQRPHSPVQVQYQLPTDRAPGRDITRRTVPPGNMRSEWHEKSRVRVKGAYEPQGMTDWRQFDSNKHYRSGRQDGFTGDMHEREHLDAKGQMGMPFEPHEIDYLTGHAHGLADGQQHAHNEFGKADRLKALWGEHGVDQETHDLELKYRESALTPAHDWTRLALAAGVSPTDALAALKTSGMSHAAARAVLDYAVASWDASAVLADGEPGFLLDVDPQTRIATLTDGREVSADLISLAEYTFNQADEGIPDHLPDSEPMGGETADGGSAMQATGTVYNDDGSARRGPEWRGWAWHGRQDIAHEATYDNSSFGVGSPTSPYRSNPPHTTSDNPASTGWATSADPPNWELQVRAPSNLTTWNASLHTAAEDDPPSVSGVALKAGDTGRVLMIQRGLEDEKDPARGKWEFPGGHHEEGDQTSLHAGVREWEEEVGQPFPSGGHLTGVSRNGPYLLHHVVIPSESDVKFGDGRGTVNPDNPDGDAHEQSAWWEIEHAKKNPALREEVKTTPWADLQKAAHVIPVTMVRGNADVGTYKPTTAGGTTTAAIDSDRDSSAGPGLDPGYTHAIDNEPHQLPEHWNDERGRARANNYTQGYSEGRNAQGEKWGSRQTVAAWGLPKENADDYINTHGAARYKSRYAAGWKRSQTHGSIPETGVDSDLAWEHGYMDDATGMEKWHSRHCSDPGRHETCPEAASFDKTATLNETPEPALPSTDGATEDPDAVEGADGGATPVAPEPLDTMRQAEWGFPEATAYPQAGEQGVDPADMNSVTEAPPGGGDAGLMSSPTNSSVVASVDPILAEFWKTAGGAALRADASSPASGTEGSRGGAGEFSDSDIASAARAVLAKMGAKDFDYAEQRELIEEGLTSNARARNFDELDLEGTHYALLDDTVSDDETLWL